MEQAGPGTGGLQSDWLVRQRTGADSKGRGRHRRSAPGVCGTGGDGGDLMTFEMRDEVKTVAPAAAQAG